MSFVIKNRVSLPSLTKIDECPLYVKFIGKMFLGKEIKENGKPKNRATIVQVELLADYGPAAKAGNVYQMVCNKVLAGTLEESYPDHSYVGKMFEIVQYAKKEGKTYKTYSINEVEIA